ADIRIMSPEVRKIVGLHENPTGNLALQTGADHIKGSGPPDLVRRHPRDALPIAEGGVGVWNLAEYVLRKGCVPVEVDAIWIGIGERAAGSLKAGMIRRIDVGVGDALVDEPGKAAEHRFRRRLIGNPEPGRNGVPPDFPAAIGADRPGSGSHVLHSALPAGGPGVRRVEVDVRQLPEALGIGYGDVISQSGVDG